MSNPNNYTVGWICSITAEYVAAQAVLDEKHKLPEMVSSNDNNSYALGRIGRHNVVIAVLPDGEYGISSAARAAADLSHSFPNVRFGLLVGTGGGVPFKDKECDMRLGDVVVSSPGEGSSNGGVFQYDFGKTIQEQSFQTTGFLNQPPRILRTAITSLKAKYELEGHRFKEAIDAILKKHPRLQGKYQRPDPSSDRLYQRHIRHPMDKKSKCAESCGNNGPNLIPRPLRTEHQDDPMIHYGLIASANQLMKDATLRDRLAAEKDVVCFEMEAAGLMNHFPCLVVRGICNYSDSHKNEEWQGYAAMVAAMYAKDLLGQIVPNRVEAEKKICDILSEHRDIAMEHRDVAMEHRDIAKEHSDITKEYFQSKEEGKRRQEEEKRRQEEEKCHQLFRLTVTRRDATYEWYKDRVETRIEDTCLWFLQHEYFQEWLKQESGPLLVSADPGCGKSVLAKYLVDEVLPRSDSTICYFFFKDQDQNTVRQALCALLHQLFTQKPCLIKHAVVEHRKDGMGLINSTRTLWNILQNAITDPQAGSIIIVLDALDECAESDFADLMHNVESHFRNDQSGKVKYLLTCRPYEAILSKFYNLQSAFPKIHIPGEEGSEAIGREINHVIQHQLNQLSRTKNLSPEITAYLKTRLQDTAHRTYLWVYLIFDYLKRENFKKTLPAVQSLLILPQNVNEAYEKILDRSKQDPIVRKILNIIFAARQPLTVAEMNVALNIDISSLTLDLEREEDFKSRLRSWCGLFISIHHDKIYFLHQTAREFLQGSSSLATIPAKPKRWQHSISYREAHAVLADICRAYVIHATLKIDGRVAGFGELIRYLESHPFLYYSTEYWGHHWESTGQSITSLGSIPEVVTITDLSDRLETLSMALENLFFRVYTERALNIATGFARLALASTLQDYAETEICVGRLMRYCRLKDILHLRISSPS